MIVNTPTRLNMVFADYFPRQMLRHCQNKKEVVPNLVSHRLTKRVIFPYAYVHSLPCLVGHGMGMGIGVRLAAKFHFAQNDGCLYSGARFPLADRLAKQGKSKSIG